MAPTPEAIAAAAATAAAAAKKDGDDDEKRDSGDEDDTGLLASGPYEADDIEVCFLSCHFVQFFVFRNLFP